jgi:hypothetical protein
MPFMGGQPTDLVIITKRSGKKSTCISGQRFKPLQSDFAKHLSMPNDSYMNQLVRILSTDKKKYARYLQ